MGKTLVIGQVSPYLKGWENARRAKWIFWKKTRQYSRKNCTCRACIACHWKGLVEWISSTMTENKDDIRSGNVRGIGALITCILRQWRGRAWCRGWGSPLVSPAPRPPQPTQDLLKKNIVITYCAGMDTGYWTPALRVPTPTPLPLRISKAGKIIGTRKLPPSSPLG